jgi:DNA-binding NarL/FixJ family response regulator
VLLADNTDLFRSALKRLLENYSDIELVGEASSLSQTIDLAAELKPDAVLMDLPMPCKEELEPASVKTRLLIYAEHVLTISIWNDEESQALSDSYGAVRLLDKATLGEELVPTIRRLSLDRVINP